MDPIVIAALLGAAATTTAAVAGPILNRRWMRDNIGESNGEGKLIEIGEYLKGWTVEHSKLDDERHAETTRRLDSLERGTEVVQR